jgi:hypothetical protein
MAKSPTIPTIPSLPLTQAIQVPEPVAVEPPTLVAASKPTQRLARLVPAKGFPIRHFNGGIVFVPGQPSAEVPVDAWLENQIKRGILKEV